MANVLEQICAAKKTHVAECKSRRTLSEVADAAARATPPRGFAKALRAASGDGYGLITEIKRASPSKGLIRPDFDPATLARAYADGGATCLSVLTDIPYFQGADDHLVMARAAVALPVLRKDFMVDSYQITESRALGADCILLIIAALSAGQAQELEDLAFSHGMDVLIEVHNEDELESALRLKSPLIGVNNRNLKTLVTDTATTLRLAKYIPDDRILVCESGLGGPEDLAAMARAGARCFLIGESLMHQDDVTLAVKTLLADPLPTAETAS